MATSLEATHHQAAGFAQHVWFFDQRHAFAAGFLGEFERLFANVSATLLAHDASGERDVFKACFVFPFLHLRIRAQRGVNRFRQREKLNAAVHSLGVFPEHDLVDRHIFAARIRDFVAAKIERVAGITFTRPHVGVEVEHLAQPDDGRKVNQPLVLQFRRQFFLRFRLRFARDRAEKSAGRFLERFDGAIGQCVTFLAPKFPADFARDVLGVEFQPIQHEARCLHDIIANSVARHPRNSVFSHRKATLSASAALATMRKAIVDYVGKQRIGSGERTRLVCCIRRLAESTLPIEKRTTTLRSQNPRDGKRCK